MDGRLAYGPEHLASLGQRFAGRTIDNVAMVLALVLGILAGRAIALGTIAPGALLALVAYGAVQAYSVHTTGQSLGKRLAGTVVVRVDGSKVGVFRGFLLRDALILVAGVTRILGLINAVMVFSELRRTGHDRLLDTVVLDVQAARSIGVDAEAVANVFR